MGYYFTLLGIFLNTVGALFAACAFGKNPGGAFQKDKNGVNIYLASLVHPKCFSWGLVTMALGSALQFIVTFVNKY